MDKLNLVMIQGDTFQRVLVFRHEVRIKKQASLTQLQVYPLAVDLPANAELLGSDDLVIITASPAAKGSRLLQIQPTTDKIPPQTVLSALPIDITGKSYRANVRTAYNKPIAIDMVCSPIDPVVGRLGLLVSAVDMAGVKPNCTFRDLPRDLDVQDETSLDESVARAAYVWDLEEVSGSVVEKQVWGLVFVPAEATKP